jgi:hypothetical protein
MTNLCGVSHGQLAKVELEETFSEVRTAPVQHLWTSRTQLGCLRVLLSLLGA